MSNNSLAVQRSIADYDKADRWQPVQTYLFLPNDLHTPSLSFLVCQISKQFDEEILLVCSNGVEGSLQIIRRRQGE